MGSLHRGSRQTLPELGGKADETDVKGDEEVSTPPDRLEAKLARKGFVIRLDDVETASGYDTEGKTGPMLDGFKVGNFSFCLSVTMISVEDDLDLDFNS